MLWHRVPRLRPRHPHLLRHAHTSSTKPRTSSELRKTFLDTFSSHPEHSHVLLPSASLHPHGDPSLHFTNAGMNQFKGVFLGTKSPAHSRVANAQKCVRTSDLGAVGRDGTHHSFFEMLGSWSFGDYFKEDACRMAWGMLTDEMGLDPERMSVTYFGGCDKLGLKADEETKEIWLQLGVPKDRILPFGAGENFWAMSRTGPCGPCTEIHYDRDGFNPGRVNADGGSCVELWNLVFMEHNRGKDGSLSALPMRHVDTGMGLERLTAIANGARTNYDTDLFRSLFETIERVSGKPAYEDVYSGKEDLNHYYRVLADHMRMVTCCVTDGIYPDATHRLKQVLRRSLRVSKEVFGCEQDLLAEVAVATCNVLGDHYGEIPRNLGRLDTVLEFEAELCKQQEETGKKFYSKLCDLDSRFEGVNEVEAPLYFQALNVIKKHNLVKEDNVLDGDVAFKLYDSVGLHSDQLEILANRAGFKYDGTSFEEALHERKIASQSKSAVAKDLSSVPSTDDSFKYVVENPSPNKYLLPQMAATVLGIYNEAGEKVKSLSNGERGSVHTDKTTFYADAGGQAGDIGTLNSKKGPTIHFKVEDCVRVGGCSDKIAHVGQVSHGTIKVGDVINTKIDTAHRLSMMQNHTGLHLLHAAINEKLPLTSQRGSRVTAKGFRLDLSTFGADINVAFVADVEEYLSRQIEAAFPIVREEVTREEMEAMEDVVTLPGVAYPDKVFLIQTPGGQTEPCGGTHCFNSSDLQTVSVIEVKSICPGAKSFHCVTGEQAVRAHKNGIAILERVQAVNHEIKALEDDSSQSDLKRVLQSVHSAQKRLTKSNLVPYTVMTEVTAMLSDMEAQIKSTIKASGKTNLVEELKAVLARSGDAKFILHSCRNDAEKLALHSLTKLCEGKPILVVCEGAKMLQAKAVVPVSFVTESFSAESWMAPVMAALGMGSMSPPKGQDPRLIMNYRVKNKVPDANLVAKALQEADSFARDNIK